MLFDAYLVVDWSANSRPKVGKDSIWLAYHEGTTTVLNIPTRFAARVQIEQLLTEAVGRGLRVLACFDFPYAYPKGYADALGLPGTPWRAIWQELARLIEDDSSNRNNRWGVAATLNAKLATDQGPFWNVPPSYATQYLRITKPAFPCGGMGEYRLVEQRLRSSGRPAHSTWKLFTTGSVGSQALLGIPILESLISNRSLAGCSRVWPFDTGSTATPSPVCGPCIVHAEIWPGAFPIDRSLHEVLDAAQVHGLADRFAREDLAGDLGKRFQIDAQDAMLREEGWILGA